jgi:capsular polysaccharide transport system permease protein
MTGSETRLTQRAYFDEYVDLVPVNANRRVTFLPQTGVRMFTAGGLAGRYGRLFAFVVIPTFLAAVYFLIFAADRYESEARFAVRRPAGASTGKLSDLLQASGPTRAVDEAYAVDEYIRSRDAMNDLVANHGFDDAIARSGADPLWAFPSLLGSSSSEAKFAYFRRLISTTNDTTTGINTVRVEAFRPEDAQRLAVALLEGAENMINRLNERAANDALAAVEAQAADLKARLDAAQAALVGFRTREEVVDPTRLSLSVLQTIALLTVQKAESEAALADMERGSPRSPQIEVLRRRIAAIDGQIAVERKKLGGDDDALANVIAEYESLMLEREFSQRAYSAALAAVELTKSENRKQRVYVERIVEPQLSDEARYPYRLLWIAVVFLTGIVVLRVSAVIYRRMA